MLWRCEICVVDFCASDFGFRKFQKKKSWSPSMPRSHAVDVFHFYGLESTVSRILQGGVFKGRR